MYIVYLCDRMGMTEWWFVNITTRSHTPMALLSGTGRYTQ